MCGGFGDARGATAEEQEILNMVKAEVCNRLGTPAGENPDISLSVTHCKIQVVAGKLSPSIT